MKLAFISPYPPSQVTLNEYGYHLIRSFIGKSELEKIYILTNNLDNNSDYKKYSDPALEIIPCWNFDDPFNGNTTGSASNVTHSFVEPGYYRVQYCVDVPTR